MRLLTQIMSKLPDLPLRHRTFLLYSPVPPPRSPSLSISSLATSASTTRSKPPNPNPKQYHEHRRPPPKPSTSSSVANASWINNWSPLRNPEPERGRASTGLAVEEDRAERVGASGGSAIDRIVNTLRNLGLDSDDDNEEEEEDEEEVVFGDLLKRDWIRPDTMLVEEKGKNEEKRLLPWQRGEERGTERDGKKGRVKVKAATLAELTLNEEKLRRLRKAGMALKDKINVAKAGVTREVVEKIHKQWRSEELVRLKFHEALTHDMKTAHEIVERRTGGLVVYRSGSVMAVYRGSNYKGPPSRLQHGDGGSNVPFVADVSATKSFATNNRDSSGSDVDNSSLTMLHNEYHHIMTQEEVEDNDMLDGLGPRFVDWWGTGVLPVDGDLLPQTLPGFKPPLRLVPVGIRAEVTDKELTTLRKLAKSLPCHFALGTVLLSIICSNFISFHSYLLKIYLNHEGRNRHHQGLAAAIIRLWEKSLVVKIAVKQGVQNTNNKLMADELKRLTGGVLLMRNKYFITIYRGKDFVPTSVAAALAERQELTMSMQDAEEQARNRTVKEMPPGEEQACVVGTLAEFYESQATWGREISNEEREKMIASASRAKSVRQVNQIEHKLALAQIKKHRAEKLLAKIEASMMPAGPPDDQETITNEERVMFRKVGLSMKAFLPLGVRGIFDGVIENMHLHWKHRELVKLITKQTTLTFVEETAKLLEYESGGILVAIVRIPKGYALIYYHGKNYSRPISIRPRNMLTKQKAFKRAIALQRHEGDPKHVGNDNWSSHDFETVSRTINQSEDEGADHSDEEYDSDSEDEDDIENFASLISRNSSRRVKG
ncbi:CRM-domain containing factor CFM3, chloroplastic/mitochondrial-like protein [Drosera capensis]